MSGNLQPQQYCLRWNNHQHNLLSVFEDLLNHEAFVDVTLAVEGLQLKAHKMVLSACSPYFQSMLYNTPDRHPIVFLRDVRYSEMKALLEFMYRGEVSVDQENLSSLLKVAEGLKIKGLAEVTEVKEAKSVAGAASPSGANSVNNSVGPSTTLSGAAGYLSALSGLSGLLSPDHLVVPHHLSSPLKRMAASPLVNPPPPPPPPSNSGNVATNSNAFSSLGPKRKRGRPRRLSGSEAVPLASGLSDAETNDDLEPKNEKELLERSESTPPGELLTPKKEEPTSNPEDPLTCSPPSPKSPPPPPSSGRRIQCSNEPKSMSEMSVRGLDLLRYADISRDGTYRCRECEKLRIIKNFKNKYSFQRHAFLYHEGSSRKVFPCSICHKEFSRPDKMKQHLKVAHDCVIPSKASSKNNSSSSSASNNASADLVKIEEGPPSTTTLLVNPFLQHLSDPTSTDGKIKSIKDSGSRVQ